MFCRRNDQTYLNTGGFTKSLNLCELFLHSFYCDNVAIHRNTHCPCTFSWFKRTVIAVEAKREGLSIDYMCIREMVLWQLWQVQNPVVFVRSKATENP